MKYKIKEFLISDLIKLIEEDKLDLKPYYQRNDIWSKSDQLDLIDSILKGYPLPSFFIYEKGSNLFEMVDGQQRSRTIFRFFRNEISSKELKIFKDIESDCFLNYKLSVTTISEIKSYKELEEFYVLVNKKGKHLTKPELFKAEFSSTNFLNLVEGLLDYQPLIELNIFSESSKVRMNDRDFIEELVAFLIFGIQDKKNIIEEIYKKDISVSDSQNFEEKFKKIIDRVFQLDEIVPISKTRFKQRNDFYTFFNFVNNWIEEPLELQIEQYRSLLLIAPYISPSIIDCPPLREYAINCVSQSNSKKAREARLNFLNQILRNREENIENNKVLGQISDYLESKELFEFKVRNCFGFYLLVKD